MLYSKANLKVALVASKDPFDKALNGVRFEADGSTVAGNASVLMAVGPAQEHRVHFPDVGAQITPGDRGFVAGLELINSVIKNMPRDKRVSLQHVALTKAQDVREIGFTAVNASGRKHREEAMPLTFPYPNWKSAVQAVRGDAQGLRICLNRKDLIDLLKAMEEACPDKAGKNPVYVEVADKGLILRGENYDTGQRAIGCIKAYNVGEWLKETVWEEGVFGKIIKDLVKKIRKLL